MAADRGHSATHPHPRGLRLESRRIQRGKARHDLADPAIHGKPRRVRIEAPLPELVELAATVSSQRLQRFHGTSAGLSVVRQNGAF
jgi:hypothetical protein